MNLPRLDALLMKRAQKVVSGCLALLLVAAAWWAAVRIRSLEQQVRELEASSRRLEASHRALLNALLQGTPEEQARAKIEIIRELQSLPPPKSVELAPAVTVVNTPPQEPKSK